MALAGAEAPETPLSRIEDARQSLEQKRTEARERESLKKGLQEIGERIDRALSGPAKLEILTRLTEIAYQKGKDSAAEKGARYLKSIAAEKGQVESSILGIYLVEKVVDMIHDIDARDLIDPGIRSYFRDEVIPQLEEQSKSYWGETYAFQRKGVNEKIREVRQKLADADAAAVDMKQKTKAA